MNKSSLFALSLGLLAVLSRLDLVVNGKPAEPPSRVVCCRLRIQVCCDSALKARSTSARVRRRAQAMAVKSTLLGSLHDARAEVEHPGVRVIEESYYRA